MNASRKSKVDKANKKESGKLSKGFECLVHKIESENNDNTRPPYDYDFVIVGSGYGGAIAAEQLSACKESGKDLKICLLERGNEYLPGSFPTGISEAPGYVRATTPGQNEIIGVSDGLFDFRINPDMSAVVASGIGGGSLINAGVMEAPDPGVFDSRWPGELQGLSDPYNSNREFFEKARELLGVSQTIKDHETLPQKYTAHEKLAANGKCGKFRAAQITVAMNDRKTESNLRLDKCIQCGDCVTGCNFGAKESLDTNLLDLASFRGVKLYHGATVERIERIDPSDDLQGRRGWKLVVNYTHKQLRRRQRKPVEVVARRVILAAGTFGSTEILKRSETDSLTFSPMLGRKFSGNGDMIASAYAQTGKVESVARYDVAPAKRSVGPSITGIIEVDRGEDKRPFIVEELAIPNTLHHFYEELVTTAQSLREIRRSDCGQHHDGAVSPDPFAIDRDAIDRTAVMAILGDDGAGGELDFGDAAMSDREVGCLNVKWPDAKYASVFEEQVGVLKRLCEDSGLEGSVIPNPFWQFLPKEIDFLAESNLRGPLLTVHPLGGCPMGKDVVSGVVDQYGRVFDDRDLNGGFHEGLVVLDGSIVPTALEINPALTIAALSLRAMKYLIGEWGLKHVKNGLPVERKREEFRAVPKAAKPRVKPTKVQLLERIGGKAYLPGPGGTRPYYIEITLRSCSAKLRSMIGSGCKRLKIDRHQEDPETASRIRIFELNDWEQINDRYLKSVNNELKGDSTHMEDRESDIEKRLDKTAVFSAPISGRIELFNRKASSAFKRRRKAIFAWLFNRGLRDIWQTIERQIFDWTRRLFSSSRDTTVAAPASRQGFLFRAKKKIIEILALSSRAGEIRTFDYVLRIEKPVKFDPKFDFRAAGLKPGETLLGKKYLTYCRRANPWRQLMELRLESFPGKSKPVLSLDLKYLARQGVPLFRITQQHDQPSALADFAALLAYTMRFLLYSHVWSFRQPDEPGDKTPQRYPVPQRWLPEPVVYELPTGEIRDGEAVKFRLTRYPKPSGPPIIAMHGYSISGSMFAHPKIVPNAAVYFYERGYDVWILDLRTSGASRSALQDWSFEEVAFRDIPLAFQHVYAETKQPINVLAHCMSAAMLSMAILKKPRKNNRLFRARTNLPEWINCIALSQVGPKVFFSPANIFRAYLANYLLPLLPASTFQFRPEGEPTLLDRLIDRILSTLPYPVDEFDRENPPYKFWKKVPYTRTRHRADFLYGRDFSIKNVSDELLDDIDDIFGFLNIRTISQTIHFARWKTITTRGGYNDFVSRGTIRERWKFNTLCVHGYENDLSDVATIELNRRILEDAGVNFEKEVFTNMGHMDCIIGTGASRVFERIEKFFRENRKDSSEQAESAAKAMEEQDAIERDFVAHPPSVGPHIGRWVTDPYRNVGELLPVTVGSSPGMISAALIVVLPVKENKDHFEEVGGGERRIFFVHNGKRELRKLAVPDTIKVSDAVGAIVLYLHNDHDGLNDSVFDKDPYVQDGMLMGQEVYHSVLDEHWQAIPPGDPGIRIRRRDIPNLDNVVKKARFIIKFRTESKDDIGNAINSQLQRPKTELESCFIDIGFNKGGGSSRSNEPSQRLSFALASCQYPAGLFDSVPAYDSYRRLAERTTTKKDLSFLLLVGDQVYVDATAGLFDIVRRDDKYRRPYQMLYRNVHVRKVMRCLPTYNMLDDHEIDDNWEPIPEDDKNSDLKKTGFEAFLNWQEKYNNARINRKRDDDLWYDFKVAGISFFVIDSRTDREVRTASNFNTANIMQSRSRPENDSYQSSQVADLAKWLRAQDRESLVFIVSPAIPFPRSRHLTLKPSSPEVVRSDRWDGYPRSHEALIRFLWAARFRNVVLLSGDEHVSMVSKVTVKEASGKSKSSHELCLISIHSSGLYAPFPFANARVDDFQLNETYHIKRKSSDLVVNVSTKMDEIYPGDGFAIVHVRKASEAWEIEVEFSRASEGDSAGSYTWKSDPVS